MPEAVAAAARRLRGVVRDTPCVLSPELGVESGVRLFLKHDHLQATGSFKERGAANALLLLDESRRRRGVVAASAGNHALGLAWHGRRLGVPVTLVMPCRAARVKVERCRSLGAEVVLEGKGFDEAGEVALNLACERNATFVHPFDDPAVIAGQGTMAVEILRQSPDVDAVVVPVGGGGLLAGLATWLKAMRPDVAVIGVEPECAASLSGALSAGACLRVSVAPTFADGLAVAQSGRYALRAARQFVDTVVTVSEAEIAWAMLRLFEAERTAVEGAGATALAAVLAGTLPWLSGKTVVVPIGGCNVDAGMFARALHLGLSRRDEVSLVP